ncbi:MAG TPA: sulfatase-like hydrolase/transferase [Polyangiaceae bacterium]|nr:sulfatase-like hydrolase/transferase [Polyangiaceae bacterium]
MTGSLRAAGGSALARLARACWAVWAVITAELAIALSLAARELTSIWEVQFGLLWLAPTALAVSALGALLGAFVAWLVEQSETRAVRALLGAFGVAAGAVLGFGVGGGRHLATLGQRGGFAMIVGALVGALVWAVAPRVARLQRERPWWCVALVTSSVALAELANRLILVRLYPAFHLGLAAWVLLTLPFAAEALLRASRSGQKSRPSSRPGRIAAAVTLGTWLLAVILVLPSAHRLARFDNFRFVVSEQAPLAGRAVELATLVVPVAAEDTLACDARSPAESAADPACQATSAEQTGRTLDLRQRDFLLISVDALRADHLGNYGYTRPTTPRIDALAKDAVVFDHAYAATPHTSYSITSLMTGKYMRPLLLQGIAQDSDTWAGLLRTYGYRTAAFYPPAVFFIDPDRFQSFRDTFLGFEYRWVEFAEGARRVQQLSAYLESAPEDKRLFAWVHLFAPHEPYENHPQFAFGERDLDRYDSEVRFADETVGALVSAFRARRPNAVVILTADHGEEFGEHGGHYHGTSVYEEQVRVPLIISAPGAARPRRIAEPVQTIDLLPTLLTALDIPKPPRLRGRDLGPLLAEKREPGAGLVLAETDEQTLLGQGSLRLICARKLGACKLFDLAHDAQQERDISADSAKAFGELRAQLKEFGASHGRYEQNGLRAEGKGWPPAILRGISGDGDAVDEIAALLDDADRAIRRKAAELLFELKRPEAKAALRLALGRDEDEVVRRYAALSLTRLGEGAPLTFELEKSPDLPVRRLAALVLAESGDGRGEKTLIAWWQDSAARNFDRSRQIAAALGTIRAKDAVWPLVQSLDDVRLRPYLADALARIGGELGQGSLLKALSNERSQSTRIALVNALVTLKTEAALAAPLVRFMGVPDPLLIGLLAAERSKILQYVGGPEGQDLHRLRSQSALGVSVTLTIPSGGNGRGVRAFVRARATGSAPGEVLIAAGAPDWGGGKKKPSLPNLDAAQALRLRIPPGPEPVVVYGELPKSVGARPGLRAKFVVFADSTVKLDAIALVPLSDELPPPKPKPWQVSAGEGSAAAPGE